MVKISSNGTFFYKNRLPYILIFSWLLYLVCFLFNKRISELLGLNIIFSLGWLFIFRNLSHVKFNEKGLEIDKIFFTYSEIMEMKKMYGHIYIVKTTSKTFLFIAKYSFKNIFRKSDVLKRIKNNIEI